MRIIVPTDFTNTSANAAQYALELTKATRLPISLIHAYHIAPQEVVKGNNAEHIKKERTEKLNLFRDELNLSLKSSKEATIDICLENGLAGDIILDTAKRLADSWIVMGTTHKKDRLKRLFGSISTRVALESSCPVLLVPEQMKFRPINKIAFCLAHDDLNEHSIKEITKLANLHNSELYLFHVLTSDKRLDYEKVMPLIRRHYPNRPIHFVNLGSPSHSKDKAEMILQYSGAYKIDLLALEKSKGGLFHDIFHKSFTKKMALSTDLPLFVVH